MKGKRNEHTIELIKERRSINFFEPSASISDDDLREILDLAAHAPSAFNMQPWEAVVVRTPEKKQALRAVAYGQPKVEEASAVVVIVANTGYVEENLDGVIKDFVAKGYMDEAGGEGYKGMIRQGAGAQDSPRRAELAIKNSMLFAMSIMYAASALGFESHPMDGFDEAGVKKLLGIADSKRIPVFITIGQLKNGMQLLPRGERRKAKDFASFV